MWVRLPPRAPFLLRTNDLGLLSCSNCEARVLHRVALRLRNDVRVNAQRRFHIGMAHLRLQHCEGNGRLG